MNAENPNPYQPPENPSLPRCDEKPVPEASGYRRRNLLLALYASTPQIAGGGLTLVVGLLLIRGAISSLRGPQRDVAAFVVCLLFAIATLAIAAMQARTAWMLLQEAWNTTKRPIEMPGRFGWDDSGFYDPPKRRARDEDFDPDQLG